MDPADADFHAAAFPAGEQVGVAWGAESFEAAGGLGEFGGGEEVVEFVAQLGAVDASALVLEEEEAGRFRGWGSGDVGDEGGRMGDEVQEVGGEVPEAAFDVGEEDDGGLGAGDEGAGGVEATDGAVMGQDITAALVAGHEAAAVVAEASVGEGSAGGHEGVGFGFEDAALEEGEAPGGEVGGGGEDASGGADPAWGFGGDRFGVAEGEGGVALGEAGIVGGRFVEGVLEAEGAEDAGGEEVTKGLAGDFFDDASEEDIAGIAIGVFGAGFEVEGAPGVLAKELVGVDGLLHAAVDVIEGVVVAVTGGVVHQVEEGDILGAGEGGVPSGDAVVDRELAVLGQEEDAGAGELFGDGADGEEGVGLDWAAVVQGSGTEAANKEGLAVMVDRDGEPDDVGFGGGCFEVGRELSGVEGGGEGLFGGGGGVGGFGGGGGGGGVWWGVGGGGGGGGGGGDGGS